MTHLQQLRLLNKTDIAVYVQKRYAKKKYKGDYYKARLWPGIQMLCDVLQRQGHDIARCTQESVTNHRVVLVSITSAIDWYSFIAERVKWPTGDYKVIIGGAGIDNVRPFLDYADIFVFGRAENIILPLIQTTLENQGYDHPSVCYADTFNVNNHYEIAQATKCYSHNVTLTNGKDWQELAIGCKRKCLFCNYSWHRQRTGTKQSDSGVAHSVWKASHESSLFQLDLKRPETWPEGAYLIFGIDGMSQRLRYMVNKPITENMLWLFMKGLQRYREKTHIIKWYQVVGYPTETEDDWNEMKELIYSSSPPRVVKDTKITKIHIQHSHFRAAPATPAATWPVAYVNFRDLIVPRLQHENCKEYKLGIYAGTTLDFNTTYATESLPTVALWMIAFRGLERDADAVREIATSRKYWSGNTEKKLQFLNELLDIERFFSWYTWGNLPTRYLHTHTSQEHMANLSDKLLRKYGGQEGVELADRIKGK